MVYSHNAPFRADVVGSYLRPAELKAAREDLSLIHILPLRPADVSHARISINATGKFDESQIDGAVKADLARLKSWNGCRVDAVRYDAKRSATLLAAEHDVTASGGSSSISTAIDEYGMDNVIYLSNDISCRAGSQNSSQDGWGSWYAWNPGSARAEHGWIFIDEGY